MTTIPVKNARQVVVRDYSKRETRDQIVAAAKRQVRSEEVTFVRRLMRRKDTD